MSNTKKVLKNSVISVFAQVLSLLFGFIHRRVFIIFLDVEYLAYQSLFSNVFSLLSVAELGIGNIIAFHLYKEVVRKDKNEIGKLMCLYKWIYRFVAMIVLCVGVGCCFLLPFFVKDATASWGYLRLIYFLQLASVILGYFLSYRRTIYIATQQEYKCVQIDLYTTVIIQTIQLGLLAVFRNYILYLCMQLSTTLIANAIIAYKSNKEFPFLKDKYRVTKEDIKKRNIFSDARNLLVHQISYAVYGGTDNIIISAFCGVKMVALYGNYVIIQKGVMGILFYKLLNPLQATLGNIIYSERKKEELWNQFEMLDVFSFFFASYIGLGFFIFFQPFIQIWMGAEYLLSFEFVVLFSITIYLEAVWEIIYKYRTVFGDYKQDRNFMLLSAILNILLSVPGAKYYGIVGVQFGTLVAYLPIAMGRIRFVVKNFFGKSVYIYLLKHLFFLFVVFFEGGLAHCITMHLSVGVFGIILRGIIWLVLPIMSSVFFWRNRSFKELINYVRNIKSIVKKG